MATVTTTSTETGKVIGDSDDWKIGLVAFYEAMSARQDDRIAAGEVDADGNPLQPLPALPDLEEAGDVLLLRKLFDGVETDLTQHTSTSAPVFSLVDVE